MRHGLASVAAFVAAFFAPSAKAAEQGSTRESLMTPEGCGPCRSLGGPSPMLGHVFVAILTGFGGRRLMNVTEGRPTMAYSETFADAGSQ